MLFGLRAFLLHSPTAHPNDNDKCCLGVFVINFSYIQTHPNDADYVRYYTHRLDAQDFNGEWC